MTAAALLLAQAAGHASPHLGGGGGGTVSFVRVAASLAICLIIAVLAVLLIRQRSGGLDLAGALRRLAPRAGRIEVLETRRLSPHADVCLLRHDGREYLLILQAGRTRILREAIVEPRPAEGPPCA